jgi:CHAD domain-containing protein
LRAAQSDSKESVEENARRLLPEMVEDLFRMGQEASRPDTSQQRMHQFRLKTKRVRYTLELFAPVYGKNTKPMLESLKGLQGTLGAINDCATTLEMIRRDRPAAAAVRRLAREREKEFRMLWQKHFGPREKARWKAVLGAADGKK